ncbi:MAG: LysM peptidoglycan-binding domain-containing protein [Ilumatobacter sp.]|uniref:LysM peptidoglycan-binding domain-containing protein n=1 Tax=Ilumatobacter sp. TaxID=1967498 RepID=UPI0026087B60|nr:LysM peptidoglycan-binding domain-containing protein [Ilumatobacter sp.]MDJ0768055.1 LysM peptidoglycan-binding domain-containing protein [Ilumatobacter sp.]
MRITPRAFAAIAFGALPLLLVTGCGSEATGSRTTLANLQGSSYVTIQPATTTTTTTVPESLEGGRNPDAQSYTVQSGDSVFKIADTFDVDPEVLANFNSWPEGVQHPLFVGDIVNIPPGAAAPGSAAATDAGTDTGTGTDTATGDETADGECPTTYVIADGDNTRIGVAERFGITFQEMDAANVNTPGYQNFVVGTPITIPCPSG